MFEKTAVRFWMIMAVALAGTLQAQTGYFPVDSVKGPMCVVMDSVNNVAVPLSPKKSTFNIVITDGLAEISLTQLFVNDYGKVNDIAYVFPLPHQAAVHAMAMEYRDSLYKAVIYEKQEAKQIYDSIVKTGGTAALLLQDRPNVFQQHIANIAFDDSAWVQIKLTMPLEYSDGFYEMAIPTMVAERYQSNGASPVPSSGKLWNPPTDRDGQSLQINILLQTGFPVAGLQSPTHQLVISEIDAVRQQLQDRGVIKKDVPLENPYNRGLYLQQANTYPNKDFVLRFSRAAADVDFTVASYFDPELSTGYFYCNLFPDTGLFTGDRPDMDIVMVMDNSGSQNGWPIVKEKEIALKVLSFLKANDRINVLTFNTSVQWCFNGPESVPVTEESIQKAQAFINSRSANGGTNALAGIQAALQTPADESKSRFFIFLTDGFITNEDAILAEIKNHPSSPTIFTFGCGNNLNRYFLDEAAKVGNGVSTEITRTEEVDQIVATVWSKLESPQLKDIWIACSGLEAAQLLMPNGSMLYKGTPVTLFGVYREGGRHTVTVTGDRDGETVTLEKEIDLASVPNGNRMIPQVWARYMIRKLRIEEETTTNNKSHIIELSRQYQVLSDYTAFLAISPTEATDENRISQPTLAITTKTLGDALPPVSVKMVSRQLLIEANAGVFIQEVRIYDMAGRCIYKFTVRDSRCTRLIWDGILANGMQLARGRFVMKIRTTGGFITRPLFWK